MPLFLRLMAAELLKLKRSLALRTVLLMPLLFVALDFIFRKGLLHLHQQPPLFLLQLQRMPIKSLAVLWAGFFHPLLLAILPALLFRPEHRFHLWKHLHALPPSRRALFVAKVMAVLLAVGCALALALVGLRLEWSALARLNPLLAFPFPWRFTFGILAWLYLGSLPLLVFYCWFADRISSSVVVLMFGLVGQILTISLGGATLDPLWKKDLIPWVLPYVMAQHASAEAEVGIANPFHLAPAKLDPKAFGRKDVILPSGRKIIVDIPSPDELLKPPQPTPTSVLVSFSLLAALALLGLGLWDSGRERS